MGKGPTDLQPGVSNPDVNIFWSLASDVLRDDAGIDTATPFTTVNSNNKHDTRDSTGKKYHPYLFSSSAVFIADVGGDSDTSSYLMHNSL